MILAHQEVSARRQPSRLQGLALRRQSPSVRPSDCCLQRSRFTGTAAYCHVDAAMRHGRHRYCLFRRLCFLATSLSAEDKELSRSLSSFSNCRPHERGGACRAAAAGGHPHRALQQRCARPLGGPRVRLAQERCRGPVHAAPRPLPACGRQLGRTHLRLLPPAADPPGARPALHAVGRLADRSERTCTFCHRSCG